MVGTRRMWRTPFLVLCLAGCSSSSIYSLALVFPDEEARAITSLVTIFALEPDSHSCEELLSGQILVSDLITLSEVQTAPTTGTATLPRVPEGDVLFFATGATDSGAEVLRGCAAVNVSAGKDLTVTIQFAWVCQPDPGGEIPNNGVDDDCDGLTDNCDQATICNDGNGCTIDLCLQQECIHVDADDDMPCTDGDACTLDDHCVSGTCTGTEMDCTALDQPCATGICDPVSLECITEPVEDGTECDDGLYCTSGDICQQGVCSGEPIDCADTNACTEDVCNEGDHQCTHSMVPVPGAEGPAGDESCSNLQDDDCDGLTDGTDPNCTGCAEALECDDDNPCTEDVCDVGICKNNLLPIGTPCDDCLYCTTGDACDAGNCVGVERDCSEVEDPCHTGTCSEAEGRCIAQQKSMGSGCDDGEYCTVGDYCRSSGNCHGTDRTCGDDEPCTLDVCRENSDQCENTWQEFPGAEGPAGDATCSNDLDDDCDGTTDSMDIDCIP